MTELMIMFHGRPATSSSLKHTVAYGPKVSEIDDFGGSSSPVSYGTNMTELMIWVGRLRLLHMVLRCSCSF